MLLLIRWWVAPTGSRIHSRMQTIVLLRRRHHHGQRLVVLQLRPIPADDVGHVVRGESVAEDPRGGLADEVRAQVQRRQTGTPERCIDRGDVDVDEFQPGARHAGAAVEVGCDIEVGCAGDVLPGYVGNLELFCGAFVFSGTFSGREEGGERLTTLESQTAGSFPYTHL